MEQSKIIDTLETYHWGAGRIIGGGLEARHRGRCASMEGKAMGGLLVSGVGGVRSSAAVEGRDVQDDLLLLRTKKH